MIEQSLFERYQKIMEIVAKQAARKYGFEWREVYSELYLALARSAGKYQGKNHASEKTFYERVFRNAVIDFWRRENSKQRQNEFYFPW